MARKYSTKSASRRWPVQMFYNVLDLAAINAFVLYKNVTKKISRHEFLLILLENIRIQIHGQGKNQGYDDDDYSDLEETITLPKSRKNCQIGCDKTKRNKTTSKCSRCKRFVCGKCVSHTKELKVCKLCNCN